MPEAKSKRPPLPEPDSDFYQVHQILRDDEDAAVLRVSEGRIPAY